MTQSDKKIMELRIELGTDRLRELSSSYGQNAKRVIDYRTKLDKLKYQFQKKYLIDK